jgi:hypothetical protein
MTSLRHLTPWLAIGIWTRLLSSYPEYSRGDAGRTFPRLLAWSIFFSVVAVWRSIYRLAPSLWAGMNASRVVDEDRE